jgi:hypothetical protein
VALLCLTLAVQLRADTISGTVKDPSGAVVAGARVEITGGNLTQAIVLTSDETGKFAAPNLNPGSYSVRVAKDGFDDLVKAVELKGTAELALSLTIAEQKTSVNVSEKNTAFMNSDAGYRQLRDMGLGDSYRLENFTLNMDAGTFQFKSGTITFLALVDRLETGAIFVGQGHFTLQPADDINKREMLRRSGGERRGRLQRSGVSFHRQPICAFPIGAGRTNGNATGSGRGVCALEREGAPPARNSRRIHAGNSAERND